MNRRFRLTRKRFTGIALLAALLLAAPIATAEEKIEGKTSPSPLPVRMNPERLAGKGLAPGEPFILPESIIEGKHEPRGEVLFRGGELVIEVYEDEPATFSITEPFPHDEFVLILSGQLLLTDSMGQVHEYRAGDSLMVPKGFTGIWKMAGNFRELVAINREAYDKAYGTAEE